MIGLENDLEISELTTALWKLFDNGENIYVGYTPPESDPEISCLVNHHDNYFKTSIITSVNDDYDLGLLELRLAKFLSNHFNMTTICDTSEVSDLKDGTNIVMWRNNKSYLIDDSSTWLDLGAIKIAKEIKLPPT